MFTTLSSLEETKEKISASRMTLLYITQPNCSVCQGLLPQIAQLLGDFPAINAYQIDASEVPAIAGEYNIFTAPVILFFVDGKEYIREARFVETRKLHDRLHRIYKEIAEQS